MKKLFLLMLTVALVSATASAEPDLVPDALETIYGTSQIFTEVSADQLWKDLNGGVDAKGKWAGHDHEFGIAYYTSDSYASTATFPNASGGSDNNSWDPGDSGSFDIKNNETFVFWLKDLNNGNTYYSDNSMNTVDTFNHMRTFELDGVSDTDGHQVYVVCWEDLPSGGDQDWQDNITEISGAVPIPAPGAILLGSLGTVLIGYLKRKRAL